MPRFYPSALICFMAVDSRFYRKRKTWLHFELYSIKNGGTERIFADTVYPLPFPEDDCPEGEISRIV